MTGDENISYYEYVSRKFLSEKKGMIGLLICPDILVRVL